VRILAIGDVFGRVGRRVLKNSLNNVLAMTKADFVMANGENLAGGFGFTRDLLGEVFGAGVDVVTTGNHVWDKKEALQLVESDSRVLRPANYPDTAPGRGSGVYATKSGVKIGVINVMGRVFMDSIDCPFQRVERELEKISKETNVIVVDMHGEASSEKQAMGYFLDGRVSAVLGTHTHVQTADERVLPRSTAYITDLGMTGPSHSVIGVKVDIILKRFVRKLPERFDEAMGPGQLNAALVEVNDDTGRAKSISRIQAAYE